MLQDTVVSFFLAAISLLGICSDKITIHNASEQDIFVAFYYTQKKPFAHNHNIFIYPDTEGADTGISRVSNSPILHIPAHGSFSFSRPALQLHSFFPLHMQDRQMVCSTRHEFVEQFVMARSNAVMQHMNACVVHNVGIKNGRNFYIDVHEHDGVHIHNVGTCSQISGR